MISLADLPNISETTESRAILHTVKPFWKRFFSLLRILTFVFIPICAASDSGGMEFTMSITIDFTPADIQLIQQQATAGNVSIEQFSREAILKAARNAEYVAKLKKSEEQINQGNVVKFSDEEWESFINA